MGINLAWVRCEKCGEYVPWDAYPQKHECGQTIKEPINFKKFTHSEMLDYYMQHPNEIEDGMEILIKEMSVFRGRVDLVGRDKNGNICLIEIVHRSKWDKASWIRKLQKYRSNLKQIAKLFFDIRDIKNIRLLLKKSGKPTEDVSKSVASLHKRKKH